VPIGARLAERRVRAFFLSAFLMLFAHAVLYAFFSLHLAELGYSKTAIGVLWAIGVVAEIVVFWLQRGLFERFGAPRLLRLSLAVAAIRFATIGASAGWLPALVLAQLAHAITFGVHHSATIATLQAWFEPAQQARAQALYVTIGYGFGGSAGVLVASWVWSAVSPGAAFLVSGAAATIGWWVLRGVASSDRIPVGKEETA
jgi:PPP family 3-phenylpropionic acid transporter